MFIAYGNNLQNSGASFENRSFYDNIVLPISQNEVSHLPNEIFIDLFINKPFYGRIDHESDCISLVSKKNMVIDYKKPPIGQPPFQVSPYLKKFPNTEISAVNFVVDAFQDLSNTYEKFVLVNPQLSFEQKFSAMEPKAGWISSTNYYNDFLDDVYIDFRDYYRNNDGDMKIKQYSDFIPYFIDYLLINIEDFSILYSDFTISRYSSPNASGLIVQFSIDDDSDDFIKSSQYLNNKFYINVINLATKYGFYIDRNVPWKLIANLSSKNMLPYMKRYGINDHRDLFKKYYIKSYFYDLYYLRDALVYIYVKLSNQFKTYKVHTYKNCKEYLLEKDLISTSVEQVFSKNSLYNLLFHYIRLRAASVRSKFDIYKLNDIYNVAKNMFLVKGEQASLSYINTIFNGYGDLLLKKEAFTPK